MSTLHTHLSDCMYTGDEHAAHVHACVRDCVSATVAHVSLCACSVCVLCDVTASNTRDSYTDGEHCAPGTPALTVRDARCTLHTAHCTLRRMACMLETVSEHAARTLE